MSILFNTRRAKMTLFLNLFTDDTDDTTVITMYINYSTIQSYPTRNLVHFVQYMPGSSQTNAHIKLICKMDEFDSIIARFTLFMIASESPSR